VKLIIEMTYAAEISPLGKDEPMRWSCVDDNYEPGAIQGFGKDEMSAIEDYIEQWRDRYEDGECPECGPPEPWGPTPEELKRQKALPEQSEADHVWNTGKHSWEE